VSRPTRRSNQSSIRKDEQRLIAGEEYLNITKRKGYVRTAIKNCLIILIIMTVMKAERRGRNLEKGPPVRWPAEEFAVF
jgi:hypothetical protein